jgi:hypothetical protein
MTDPVAEALTPRTEAGRRVVEATASDPFIPDDQKAALRTAAAKAVLAIEDEARAQGALHEHLAAEGDIERAVDGDAVRAAAPEPGLNEEDWAAIDGCLSACANDPTEPERYRVWYADVLAKVRALRADLAPEESKP